MKLRPSNLKLFAAAVATAAVLHPSFSEAKARVLKFSGVPVTQAATIKNEFPFVFEREVTLAEVDDVVRFLMKTGNYSNIEVIERDSAETGERELVLVANQLRRIQNIAITGNSALPTPEIQRLLNISVGQTFERKNLLAAAEELRKVYEGLGYHNAKVEIEFDLPNQDDVKIKVAINEGTPLRVSDVTIDTPNIELTAKLQRTARSFRGEILTDDHLLDFQKEVSEYLRNNRFLTARLGNPAIVYNADRTQAKLTYAVENPWKFEFRLEGNQHFTDGTIIRWLEEEKLSGAVSSPAPDMADKIRRQYQAVGYANVEVTYVETAKEGTFKDIIRFTIKEGPRVRIKKIQIEGNVSRPESYYTQFIKSTSSDLIGAGFYNRKDVDDGTKRLITELQNQGFLRARVQSQRSEYSKDKSSVTVYLTIDEGPLTQIRQIRFEGVESFSRVQLTEILKIKTGAALSLRDLEDSIAQLKEFYRQEGFLEMRILNENEQSRIVTYNDTNTQATVEFQIYEGPRVTVGSIETQGNSFTKDYVILRELGFQKGDVLTPTMIEDSIYRLQRLGLFTSVSVRMLEEGTNISERTIIIEVTERDPGLFTAGFGVNNDRGLTFRGYLGVAYRNMNGTGRAFSFRVDPRYSTDPEISYLEHAITASYLEPYILGYRNRGRINVRREQQYYELSSAGRPEIIEDNAVNLILERDLTRHIKMTYNAYGFTNSRRFLRTNYETLETTNIGKTGPLVEFDFRDDAFNPSKGSYSFINAEYADPVLGSSEDETQTINFVKTNASMTHYQPLNEKRSVVWANAVRGGYLANVSRNPNGSIPSQEAFFLGGRTTIRGFDAGSEFEKIPNRIDLGSELPRFKVTNDSYYYLVKTELRFPIYGQFGGAIFYDGGAVLVNQGNVNITDPYRHSAGFGLRIATPVGPVNAEIGWKLDRRTLANGYKEAPWVFHFSIGAF